MNFVPSLLPAPLESLSLSIVWQLLTCSVPIQLKFCHGTSTWTSGVEAWGPSPVSHLTLILAASASLQSDTCLLRPVGPLLCWLQCHASVLTSSGREIAPK